MPPRTSPASAAIVAALLSLVAPRVARCAWPHDPFTNVQLSSVTSAQFVRSVISDGQGGAIFAWHDNRAGNLDIYAQHITAAGTVAGGWPAAGLVICNATDAQSFPVMVSDGAGGAIIAWVDARAGSGNQDIFVQRVTGSGTIPFGWPANGRQLSSVNATKDEMDPEIVSDGAGGAVVVWELVFTSGTDVDVYGGRVDAGGTVLWTGFLYQPSAIQDFPVAVSDGAAGALVAFNDNLAGNFDIRALRVGPTGSVIWGPNAVCTDVNPQFVPTIVTDGSGGAIIGWRDQRNGNVDIFALRLNSGGARVNGWNTNGTPVVVAANDQIDLATESDGNHGALFAWTDGRSGGVEVFAQHMLPGGQVDPNWPLNGLSLCSGPGFERVRGMSTDGSGGAIVTFQDERTGDANTYAARVTGAGTIPTAWPASGVPIAIAADQQLSQRIVADGNGGAVIAWVDSRDGMNELVFAQNVDHFGQLGDAAPSITSIDDVGGDQGGKVRIAWNASYLDADPQYAIAQYWIWRETPVAAAEAAVAVGGRWLDDELEARAVRISAAGWKALAGRGVFMRSDIGTTSHAWEFVVSLPASGFPQYSYVAATTRDSVGAGNPQTAFMVQARYVTGVAFWNSAPDSGYSVDNLPPVIPAPFTGTYLTGSTHLHWGANLETDLAGYRLYRGNNAGFVPGPGNLLTAQPDTGYADLGPAGGYYKLSAVDKHGNESGHALLVPAGTVDVERSAIPRELTLGPAAPMPARAGATLAFGLPVHTHVSLALYDAAGRWVRTLVDADLDAGERVERWDGRDGSGQALPSGLYFVRLSAMGRTLARRIVVAR